MMEVSGGNITQFQVYHKEEIKYELKLKWEPNACESKIDSTLIPPECKKARKLFILQPHLKRPKEERQD